MNTPDTLGDQANDRNTPSPIGCVADSDSSSKQAAECPPVPQGDVSASIQFIQSFFEPGDCIELRAFGVRSDSLVVHARDSAAVGQFVARNLAKTGNTIAFKVNPVQPHLAQDAPLKAVSKQGVERITDLYIDIDPQRASGTMATLEERTLAARRAEQVSASLHEHGFGEPGVVDSGNGLHLHYRVDLPVEDEHITRAVLRRLDSEFSDDLVKVDTAVADAARVARLPGSVNRKGEHTPERPWRACTLLSAPQRREIIPRRTLEVFAGAFAQSPSVVPRSAKAMTKAAGTASAELIEQRCGFMQHCRDNPETLSELAWFAEMGILGCCNNAEAIAHERSCGHPGYNWNETQAKIKRAIASQKPHTCAHIQNTHGDEHCKGCPHNGKIKSPIQLGYDSSLKPRRHRPGEIDQHTMGRTVPPSGADRGSDADRHSASPVGQAADVQRPTTFDDVLAKAKAHEPISHHCASDHELIQLLPKRMPESSREAALKYLEFLRETHGLEEATPVVVRYRESWYAWNGTHHKQLTNEAARTEFTRWALGMISVDSRRDAHAVRPYEPSKRWVDDFERMLLVLVPTPEQPRAWLADDDGLPDPKHLYACSNCLYDAKGRLVMPHTPWFFDIASPSPVAFEPQAPAPARYHRFMEEIIGDPKTIQMVEEFAGLALTQDTSFHKMLQIVGHPRSGKSTFVELLEGIVGPSNVVAVSPLMLNGSHGTEPLVGKTLASMGDAETCSKRELAVTVETLKKVTGEDLITVNPKNKTGYSARMPLRFVITANQELVFNDPSGALTKRYLMVETARSFYGQEDERLKADLRKEMPGILNVWLAAAHRLLERGRFDEPESSVRLRESLAKSSSPLQEFVESALLFDPAFEEPKSQVHEAYTLFSRLRGEYPKGSAQFTPPFKAAVRGYSVTEVRRACDRRRVWRGTKLAPLWRQALNNETPDSQLRHLLDLPSDAVKEPPRSPERPVHLVHVASASGPEHMDVEIKAENALKPDFDEGVQVVQVNSESSKEPRTVVAPLQNPHEQVDQVDGDMPLPPLPGHMAVLNRDAQNGDAVQAEA